MDNIKFIANVTKQNFGYKQTMQNNDVTLEITPIVDGKYLNLTGSIISLNWLKPDNQLVTIAGSAITVAGSNVLVVLPKDCTSVPGEVKFELVITQSDKQTSTFPLSLNVAKSVYQALVGSTSFAGVVQDINEANASATDILGQVTQAKDDLTSIIKSGGVVKSVDYSIDKINLNNNLQTITNSVTSVNSNLGDKTTLPTSDKTSFVKSIVEMYNLLTNKYTKSDIQSNVGFGDINKNLSKIDSTMISDSLLQQIAGTASVNATVGVDGITTDKIAKSSITLPLLSGKMYSMLFNDINGVNTSVVTGTSLALNNTRLTKDPFPKGGFLRSLRLYTAAGGTAKIKAFSMNLDGTFNFQWEFIVTLSGGDQTLYAGKDFPEQLVQAGWYLGFCGISSIICYTTSGVGSLAYSGDATGNNLAFASSGATLSLSYVVSEINISKLLTNTDIFQKDINTIYKNYKSGSDYLAGSPYAFLATSTRVSTYNPTKAGRVKKIFVNVDSIGTLKIKFFSKNSDGTYKYEKEIVVSCVAGNNTYVDGVNFQDLIVGSNWYIGIFSSTVKIAYNGAWTENNKNGTISGDAYGASNVLSLAGYSIALNAEIEEDSKINNLETSITNNSNRISILENKLVSNKSITTTSFSGTSLSSDFIMSGAWTVNYGLQSPTSGDLSTYVIWNKYCSLDRKILRMRIKINDATSKFSLIHKNNMYNGVNGTIAEIDCSNKKLNLYGQWDGTTTLPAIVKSADITFDFVASRDYLVSLEKFAGKSTLTIIDTVTQLSSSLILDENVDLKICGAQTGSPGIMFTSGNIFVKKFEFITPIGKTPYVAMFGDSITEGNSLYNSVGGYTNRYCYKIYEALNGDVAICGKSGETSTGLLQRYELDYFLAKYIMVLIGTNDTDYSTWLGNIGTIINRITNLGATPILSTIPPREDRQDFINQANAYIRTSGYAYVDYDSALTLNNDGVNQNPDLFLGDKIHPNPTGHTAMFNQAKIDLPFLFD